MSAPSGTPAASPPPPASSSPPPPRPGPAPAPVYVPSEEERALLQSLQQEMFKKSLLGFGLGFGFATGILLCTTCSFLFLSSDVLFKDLSILLLLLLLLLIPFPFPNLILC